ncbi:MAG: hypothetical protein Q4C87_03400 [Actinomycetaceae bacterium]|nr:hypothetical protein [Actinomycetaceae bacterium]
MSENPRPTLLLILGAALALVAGGFAIFALMGGGQNLLPQSTSAGPQSGDAPPSSIDDAVSGSDLPTPQSGANAPQSAPLVPITKVEASTENEALEGVLNQTAESLAAPNPETDLSPILSGEALESHQVTLQQWSAEKLRQEGAPTIASSNVVSNEGGKMTVEACIDSSAVKVLDENGQEVGDPEAPTRSKHIFILEQADGAWKVVSDSFAEDPQC